MENYPQFLAHLRKAMRNEYLAVNRKLNPVSVNLPTTTPDQLIHIIQQYTLFPKQIVSFLRIAQEAAAKHNWQEIQDELQRNIGEEQGSQTEGIPHYDMLVKGISEELGPDLGYAPMADLENRLRFLDASPTMDMFLNRMPEIVGNTDPAYAIGAAYALESSAVPELVIVRSAVEKAISIITCSPMVRSGYLGKFFDAHLKIWEPGHEEGLRRTSEAYITTSESQIGFEKGFRDTMKAMDSMWIGLYNESQNLISSDS